MRCVKERIVSPNLPCGSDVETKKNTFRRRKVRKDKTKPHCFVQQGRNKSYFRFRQKSRCPPVYLTYPVLAGFTVTDSRGFSPHSAAVQSGLRQTGWNCQLARRQRQTYLTIRPNNIHIISKVDGFINRKSSRRHAKAESRCPQAGFLAGRRSRSAPPTKNGSEKGETLVKRHVLCYNTRRHRRSVFRLLLHRREPNWNWDTPGRFAEQGNWVQLPDTFPGQGEVPPESVAVSIEWLPFLRKQVTGGL